MLRVVDEGAVVAVLATDIFDELLVLGRDGLLAIAQPVVHLFIIVADELGTNGTLLLARHLLVELRQSRLHHSRLVLAN